MSDLTVSYDANGPVPLTASDLRAELVAEAVALSPGLTTELPGSLIEDLASTATGALLVADGARIDLIQSVGATTANLAMLTALAQQAGIPFQKTAGETTVPLVFTGTPNYLIPKGFIVSDGTHQYTTNQDVTVRSTGTSPQVTATATATGAWAVPAGSVNLIQTSLPSNITLSVNNTIAGTAGSTAESNAQFRQRVMDAGMITVNGYPGFIRSALATVDNIDSRQTSVVQSGNNWLVMCGGGDTVDMATAIFRSAGDISRLVSSTLNVSGITNANPGVVSTDITHGFSDGQVIKITGVTGMSGINGVSLTATVIDPYSFSIGINTTNSGEWAGGGVVTPNLRNATVVINNYPDTYSIPYVQPLLQLTKITFEWATQSVNYVTDSVLLSLIQADIIAYVNSIYAGKPLNLNKLKDVFLSSINDTISMELITTLNISVTINGVLTAPDTGTNIISGDPYSYFYIEESGVAVSGA